ncbi:MAG: biotin/lipoate A/B protein ligase family protein [Armatimonadota bacterium]
MKWRLIYSPALSGARNMAIDEAMLLAHAAGLTPPTLRLYRWQPPTVSLGLLQPFEGVNEEACRQLGFEVVRRPSGGGAVLHQHEITYAVVVDGRLCPYGSSVLSIYRWLAEGLKAGLKRLGVDISSPPLPYPAAPSTEPFCFVRLTDADLSVNGRKLGGSAQARKRNFLLQHGSIPLQIDIDKIERIFGSIERERFTCVEEVLGRNVNLDEFAEALVQGFSEALGVDFTLSDLTPLEYQLADLLFRYKYNTVSWTKERRTCPDLASKIAMTLSPAISSSSAIG